MNSIGRDIFKAIHEGKWLSIEYRNKQGSLTKYWIGVYDIDVRYKRMRVEGLHLGNFQNMELTIYIDKIESSKLLDGKEHIESEIVRERDRKKNKICPGHGFELIRVENSYARRYNFIKSVLINYFGTRR